jgi:tetratricopeptide (TPR) repeat protein
MDQQRLCAVFAAGGPARERTGSGYLIAARLFLTAGHSVSGATRVEIQLISQRRSMRCAVLWEGTADGLDAALLEVEEADWPDDAPGNPVRFGMLATLRPGIACESMGFPSIQRDAQGNLDVVHASGHVNPGDRLLGQRWVFSVDGTLPAERGKSPWSGMSGAPLFSGDLLFGIIVTDSPEWRHGKLDAEQVHRLLRNERLRSLLHARLGYIPTVEGVELQDLAEPWSRTRRPRSLAELMRPQSESVRFFGRETELQELSEWCDGTGTSVRLLTGSGGQGKTRLALELARRQAAAQWVVVRVRDTVAPEHFSVLRHVRVPLLLVMDYADSRPNSVVEVMSVLEEKEDLYPVRVLLLARSAGEWWQQLPASTSAYVNLLAAAKVVQLNVLAGDQVTRQELYDRALSDLACGLSWLAGYGGTDWVQLANFARTSGQGVGAKPDSVLDLQIRAVTELLTSGLRELPVSREMPVEARLLTHEERYWLRSAGRQEQLGLLGSDALGNAVAAATLARAGTKERAIELLANIPPFHDVPEVIRIATAEWLHDLYPENPGSYWGGLEPDRIGEYHVYTRVTAEPRLLKHFLPILDSGEAYRALTVLARAGANPSILGRSMLNTVAAMIIEHPDNLAASAAYVAGRSENPDFLVRAVNEISQQSDVSLEVLEDINSAIPDHSVKLSATALNITARIVAARRRQARQVQFLRFAVGEKRDNRPARREDALSDSARAYNNHGHRLMSVERWQEASAACEHAIRIYCKLLKGRPEFFAPLLASSLDNLATALVGAALPRRALATIQDALSTHRALAKDGSNTHMANLARSLSIAAGIIGRVKDLSYVQKRVGLDVSIQAVSILSELSDRFPGRYSVELTAALQNQASQYAATGLTEEAADAGRRAVAICRRLASQHPDSGLPRLADSLHNYAIDLAESGEPLKAYEAINESILIYLQLVTGQPDAHLGHLARALNTKAAELIFAWAPGQNIESLIPGAQKWKSEAVMASAHSVLLYNHLAKSHPDEFQPILRIIVHNHRRILQYAGVFVRSDAPWNSMLTAIETFANHDPKIPLSDPGGKSGASRMVPIADAFSVSRRVRREVARLKIADGGLRHAPNVLDRESFKDVFDAIQNDRLWVRSKNRGPSRRVTDNKVVNAHEPLILINMLSQFSSYTYVVRCAESDRERAVEIIKNACANGEITIEEFDKRLTRVFSCRTLQEIYEAIHDLSQVGAAKLLLRSGAGLLGAPLPPPCWPILTEMAQAPDRRRTL